RVALVHGRAVVRLLLPLEAMGDLRGQPPERLVAGGDAEPIARGGTGPGKYGLHGSLVAVRRRRGEPWDGRGQKKAGKCTQAGAPMQRRGEVAPERPKRCPAEGLPVRIPL